MFTPASPIEQRIKRLQSHLERENPVLLDAVNDAHLFTPAKRRLGLVREKVNV